MDRFLLPIKLQNGHKWHSLLLFYRHNPFNKPEQFFVTSSISHTCRDDRFPPGHSWLSYRAVGGDQKRSVKVNQLLVWLLWCLSVYLINETVVYKRVRFWPVPEVYFFVIVCLYIHAIRPRYSSLTLAFTCASNVDAYFLLGSLRAWLIWPLEVSWFQNWTFLFCCELQEASLWQL